MVTGYGVMWTFNAIKDHFTDYIYNALDGNKRCSPKIRITEEDFNNLGKRNVVYTYLGQRHSTVKELQEYLIANFVYNPKFKSKKSCGAAKIYDFYSMTDDGEHEAAALTATRTYIRNQESLSYGFRNDIESLLNNSTSSKFNEVFAYGINGEIPKILNMVLSGQIRMESVIILNRIFPFIRERERSSRKKYTETDDIIFKMKKYGMIFPIDKKKFARIALDTHSKMV